MIYMSRLGIWGEGTPFRTFEEFLHAIEKRCALYPVPIPHMMGAGARCHPHPCPCSSGSQRDLKMQILSFLCLVLPIGLGGKGPPPHFSCSCAGPSLVQADYLLSVSKAHQALGDHRAFASALCSMHLALPRSPGLSAG